MQLPAHDLPFWEREVPEGGWVRKTKLLQIIQPLRSSSVRHWLWKYWKCSLQGYYILAQGAALGFGEWNRFSGCKPSILYCPFRAHGVFVALNPTRHFVLHWAGICRACSPKTLPIWKIKLATTLFHVERSYLYRTFERNPKRAVR